MKALLQALDKWESRLEDIFDGKPADNLDAALTDTVNRFPVDIQPFRDMIDGMRSDISKSRYQTYDDLYGYCYRVAGTVALMVMPVMGVDPKYKVIFLDIIFRNYQHACLLSTACSDEVVGPFHLSSSELQCLQGDLEPVYRAALALGTANQLTNILRDVGEDIKERNRIYVPLDELAKFNITQGDLMGGMHCTTTGKMDDRYVRFMKHMVSLTNQLSSAARLLVTCLLDSVHQHRPRPGFQ